MKRVYYLFFILSFFVTEPIWSGYRWIYKDGSYSCIDRSHISSRFNKQVEPDKCIKHNKVQISQNPDRIGFQTVNGWKYFEGDNVVQPVKRVNGVVSYITYRFDENYNLITSESLTTDGQQNDACNRSISEEAIDPCRPLIQILLRQDKGKVAKATESIFNEIKNELEKIVQEKGKSKRVTISHLELGKITVSDVTDREKNPSGKETELLLTIPLNKAVVDADMSKRLLSLPNVRAIVEAHGESVPKLELRVLLGDEKRNPIKIKDGIKISLPSDSYFLTSKGSMHPISYQQYELNQSKIQKDLPNRKGELFEKIFDNTTFIDNLKRVSEYYVASMNGPSPIDEAVQMMDRYSFLTRDDFTVDDYLKGGDLLLKASGQKKIDTFLKPNRVYDEIVKMSKEFSSGQNDPRLQSLKIYLEEHPEYELTAQDFDLLPLIENKTDPIRLKVGVMRVPDAENIQFTLHQDFSRGWSMFSYQQLADVVNNKTLVNGIKYLFSNMINNQVSKELNETLSLVLNEVISDVVTGNETLSVDLSDQSLNSLLSNGDMYDNIMRLYTKIERLHEMVQQYFDLKKPGNGDEELTHIDTKLSELRLEVEKILKSTKYVSNKKVLGLVDNMINQLEQTKDTLSLYKEGRALYLEKRTKQEKEKLKQLDASSDPFYADTVERVNNHLDKMRNNFVGQVDVRVDPSLDKKLGAWEDKVSVLKNTLLDHKNFVLKPKIEEQKINERVKVVIDTLSQGGKPFLNMTVFPGNHMLINNRDKLPCTDFPLSSNEAIFQNGGEQYDGMASINLKELNKKLATIAEKGLLDFCFVKGDSSEGSDKISVISCAQHLLTGEGSSKVKVSFKMAPVIRWDEKKKRLVFDMPKINVKTFDNIVDMNISLKAPFSVEPSVAGETQGVSAKISIEKSEEYHVNPTLSSAYRLIEHKFSGFLNGTVSSLYNVMAPQKEIKTPIIPTKPLKIHDFIARPETIVVPFSFP